jgi:hypothetical protein
MASKIFPLVFGIGLTICVARVQSQLLTGTPIESPSPAEHRTQKRIEATPPVERGASASAAESPAASPTPRRIRKKTTAEMSPSPTPTPVASPTPRKIRFPRLFKPKRSPSPTPAGVNPAPVRWNRESRKRHPLCPRGLASGRFARKALQQRWQQSGQSLLMIRGGIDFSRWR